MNLKISLLLLSATLVGTGVWLKFEDRKAILAEVEAYKMWSPNFDLNAVAEILVKTNTESLLIKKSAESWLIGDANPQTADITTIGHLVQRIKNLKPTEEVLATRAQFPTFEVLEPDGHSQGTGTLIELRDKESKRLAAIVIGKQSFAQPDPRSPFPPPPNGRFVVPAASNGPVGIIAEGFDSIRPKAEAWVQNTQSP
jgi:hypothetical protein